MFIFTWTKVNLHLITHIYVIKLVKKDELSILGKFIGVAPNSLATQYWTDIPLKENEGPHTFYLLTFFDKIRLIYTVYATDLSEMIKVASK